MFRAREELEREFGREPSVKELAEKAELAPEELTMVLESGAEVESLYRTVYKGEGTEILLMDKISEKENGQEYFLTEFFWRNFLKSLEGPERQLIFMRYIEEMTQTEIAEKLGISQVQVSRMEKRILSKLRERCK